MPHLIAISIGPVQDFIAAARKTRDLWYGSTMLSDLSRHVARTLQERHGAELIFPHPGALSASGDDRPAVANKILARLPATDPKIAADEAREAAVTWLVDRYDETVKQLHGARPYIDDEIASRQVKHFLEFYSAWVPYDPEQEDDYANKRERVEHLLAGRKALRDFIKADGKSGVPKSSLDPSRESVLNIESRAARRALRDRLNLAHREMDDGDTRLSEYLDGVSLIKRVYSIGADGARFPSVVRVAADPYIRYLEDRDPKKLEDLKTLAVRAGMEPFDTHSATTGHYASFPYDSHILFADDPEITDSEVKKEIRKLVGDQAPAYYAILAADGDRMGQHLGQMESPDEHLEFSQKLATFAQRAGSIVREYQGVPVYSGGDDVLAFLPVDTVLDCVDQLRREFQALVSQGVTISAGISVGYYREPLWLALDRARAAERAAKGPRNALAVVWHTRSGGPEAEPIISSWDDDPIADWKTWTKRFADDAIPAGAAYELRELARELKPLFETQPASNGLNDLVRAEVRRILKRKRAEGGSRSLPVDLIDEIAERCASAEALEQLVNKLIIARRFASITRLIGEEQAAP